MSKWRRIILTCAVVLIELILTGVLFIMLFRSKPYDFNGADRLVSLKGILTAAPDYFPGRKSERAYATFTIYDHDASFSLCTEDLNIIHGNGAAKKNFYSLKENDSIFFAVRAADTSAAANKEITVFSLRGNGLDIFTTDILQRQHHDKIIGITGISFMIVLVSFFAVYTSRRRK